MSEQTKSHPILFNGPMVRAILDGRKTQTRRLLKPQPDAVEARPLGFFGITNNYSFTLVGEGGSNSTLRIPIKYAAGDTLWVREAWNAFDFSQDGDDAWPTRKIPTVAEMNEEPCRFGPPQIVFRESERARKFFGDQKWRPSIHMPRWASRITLRVTDVRVERLRDISNDDAIAEGVKLKMIRGCQSIGEHQTEPLMETSISAFQSLWDSINAKTHPWESNPWVVAYTFEVVK